MTNYVVLRAGSTDDASGGWHRVSDSVKAASATAAIRVACGGQSGSFVAVPLRSWKPLKVTVATKPTVQMEDLA
jgi:hypothetical protein